jgi:hypothetical protein
MTMFTVMEEFPMSVPIKIVIKRKIDHLQYQLLLMFQVKREKIILQQGIRLLKKMSKNKKYLPMINMMRVTKV